MLFKLLICILGVASCHGSVGDILPINVTTDVPPETTTPPATTTVPPQTTTTTTAAPETTTPATTTTTATPTTPAPPTPADAGTWNVTDSQTNITCIMVTMAVQFSITYNIDANKTGVAIVNVPANTSTVSGTCGNETQEMTISWKPRDPAVMQPNTLLLVFTQNKTAENYAVSSVTLAIYADSISFPGAPANTTMKLSADASDVLPSAPIKMSYLCTPAQVYNLTSNSSMTISKMQLQAFHTDGTSQFGAASNCQAQDSADIVPIAVGCALAALVVIVLIAYLIGRRRSHAKGYLSM